MKMEFIFDKDKLKKYGYTEDECLEKIRKYFKKFKSKTLKETKRGIYEGTDDDWDAFACAANFPYTDWFLKVIKEWYWYYDEEDGKGLQKGDYLASYYKYNKSNKRNFNY